jgi:hypothetical protein
MPDDLNPVGWYPDPSGNKEMLRYWNGATWSEQVQGIPSVPSQAAAQVQPQAAALAQPQQNSQVFHQTVYPVQPFGQTQYQGQYQGHTQTYAAQQAYPQTEGSYLRTQPKTNSTRNNLATAGMVCGIAGVATTCFFIGFIPSLLGLTFGVLGLKSDRRAAAIVGIVCGAVGLVMAVGFIIIAILVGVSQGDLSSNPFSTSGWIEGQTF